MSFPRNLPSESWVRRVVVLASLAGAVLLVACTPSSDPSGDVGAGKAPGDAVEVAIEGSTFEPEVIEVTPGQEVTVQVTNDDGAPHDFAIDDLQLNTGTIESGEAAYATFTAPSQPVKFVCTFHSGMEGRIEPR